MGAERAHEGPGEQAVEDHREPQRPQHGPGDGPLGVHDLLAHRGHAGVAGEREEQHARGGQDPAEVQRRRVEPRRPAGLPEGQPGHDGQAQDQQHGSQDRHGRLRRAGDAAQRHARQDHDGDHARQACAEGGVGEEVEARRRRHGGHRGRLAGDEAPAGHEPGQGAQLPAPVDVGAARGGVDGRELRGGDRVARGHHRGEQQRGDEGAHASARELGGQAEGREDAGADHRAHADREGAGQGQAAWQRGGHGGPLVGAGRGGGTGAAGGRCPGRTSP